MNNQMTSLIKEAVKEITFILIGVLIAVAINNAVNNTKDRRVRCLYLDELIESYNDDINDLEENIDAINEWNRSIAKIAVAIQSDSIEKVDSLYYKLGEVGNYVAFIQGSLSKIDELKYSNINLIEDRNVKSDILKYQNIDIAFLRDSEKRYYDVNQSLREFYTNNFLGFNYTEAYPNDINDLRNNPKYLSLLQQKYYWNSRLVNHYDDLIIKAKMIRKSIQNITGNLNCN